MKTPQGALFGFPNPFIGIVAFAIVITSAWRCWPGTVRPLVLAGPAGRHNPGMVFMVWLWSQALYEINALCLYCMVVWAMMIPLFVVTTPATSPTA